MALQVLFDADTITQLIRFRRSVFPRQYSGEVIPREKIELLLENAHWAPNHGQTEPWFFKVFAGEGLKKLGEAHAKMYEALTPEENFNSIKYEKLRNNPLKCSHIIAICLRAGTNPKIPEIEEIAAVAAAVQNIHLTATALGLGGYWSSGGMTYREEMKTLLGLSPTDRCLGFFYLGVPTGEWPEGFRKSTWQEKVEWVE
ncbi:MAG: nitroreductase [Bacteroidia bacterium]|nr:nitroreductase [Bacteroidia bacterium]